MADRQGIQVIARAAAVLRALEREPEGLSLGEISARLGLPRSTVQRIVGALGDEQLLISAGSRAGVMLGPALIRLASAAAIETEKIARPAMQDLSRALGETVDLSVLQGRTAMFVDQIVGTRRLVATSAIGEAFPLHCTANGKALLSCLPPERRRALLSGHLVRHTARTVIDPVKLERELVDTAVRQLAYDREEHADGICAIGAAFVDPFGRAFAISVPMPAQRFVAQDQETGRALLATLAEVIRLIPGCRTSLGENAKV